jgi:unsaturated rhamnogalacturonyl hydrolase
MTHGAARSVWFFSVVGLLAASSALAQQPAAAAGPPPAFAADVEKAAILKVMTAAADWQLGHPSTHEPYDWTQAAFYTGVMAFVRVTDSPKYAAAMKAMGAANQWRPGLRPGHADDYAVAATYAQLYDREHERQMIAPSRALFDFLATRKYDEPLVWGNAIEMRELAWCDALFMAPPAMAAMSASTGDAKYLELANRLWWKTTDYLYDRDEHLYYRDSRYFDQREKNGRKVFWSRGNGWVIAGLARMLQTTPAGFRDHDRYVTLFREMAAAVLAAQSPDGYWRSSLLDPDSRPNPETSGTGFFTFSLAWGVNQGLLDRATYEPAARRGWAALVRAIHPDGLLGWVQQIGAEPGSAGADSTEVYGTGAFLLAGSEIIRLAK